MNDLFLRQISLIGKENQFLLENSKVAIIGLGGLGTVVAHLLVKMGFKNLILVDGDIVSKSNLSRQHLYTFNDLNSLKTSSLANHLLEINPSLNLTLINKRLSVVDDFDVFLGVDLIFDGLDNHATRRLLDIFSKNNNIPWIHGAAIEEKGSVFFFDNNTYYKDIYPNNAKDLHCDLFGVLVTITSLIGSLQVQLGINYILKRPIKKELIRIDLKNFSFNSFKIV